MSFRPLFAATLCASPALATALLLGSARPWEHESSDVPVDPRIHFGALDSGMRYAWTDQSKSEDHRVSLRLFVDVGSVLTGSSCNDRNPARSSHRAQRMRSSMSPIPQLRVECSENSGTTRPAARPGRGRGRISGARAIRRD